MPPFAVAPPGTARRVGLFGINRDSLSANLEQPKIKLTPACITQPRFKHDRGLEHGRRGDQTDRIVGDSQFELCRSRAR